MEQKNKSGNGFRLFALFVTIAIVYILCSSMSKADERVVLGIGWIISVNMIFNDKLSGVDLFLLVFLGGIWSWLGYALSILLIVSRWKLFKKAGQPGWASLIPFYSNYLLFKIVTGSGWMFLFSYIPIINFSIPLALHSSIAISFGKRNLGTGLLFFSSICYPILAFGSAEYIGPYNRKTRHLFRERNYSEDTSENSNEYNDIY